MMRATTLQRVLLLITMLASAGCAARAQAPGDARPGIDAVLDDFHAAAAEGAADRYLAHFTDDGVFFGTDPAERWTKQQFEPYVRRAFANGGWTYVPRDRTTLVSDGGDVAWFDEMLDSPGGTVARGTGVLVREDGRWKVAQYNFSVPFPNSLWDTILEMIREETAASQVSPGRPWYSGDVRIDPTSDLMWASWRIDFVADSSRRDSIALYLNQGLGVASIGGTNIAGFTQDADGDLVVRFAPALVAGERARVALFAIGTPTFGEDRINGIGEEWVELGLDSEWHPVIGGYDQAVRGIVRIGLPAGWDAVASGTFRREGNTLVLHNHVPLIDLAFSAAPALDSATATRASVYHVGASPDTVARVLRVADGCASWLDARFGAADPLPRAKVVLAPRTGPGYARANYIVITDVGEVPGAWLDQFLCHELAHFWSTGAVPFSPHYWMNEAFAEYVAGRYVQEVHGADGFAPILARWQEGDTGTPPIWTPAATSRPGPRVSYRKAPFLLHRFEQRIGRSAMDEVVHAYMTGRLATTPDLLAAIERSAGLEHAAWFREQLAR